MVYAPERWRAREWFSRSSRLGLRPERTASSLLATPRYRNTKTGASASEVFGPYAKSAEAELAAAAADIASEDAPPAPASPPESRADLKPRHETTAVTCPIDGARTGGLIGRLHALTEPDTEPRKKSSPILAPRGTLPRRQGTKSGTSQREKTRWEDSERVEPVVGDCSSNAETDGIGPAADHWRAAITVKP